MSAKPESTFIASVNKHLPIKKLKGNAKVRQLYSPDQHIHYEKMHNDYRGGTADGWYSGMCGDVWIEYKFLPRIPQRVSVKPLELLSTLQLDWLNERHDEGRNVAVIIGVPTGGVLLLDRSWECEIPPQEFASLIRSRNDLADWIMGQTARPR